MSLPPLLTQATPQRGGLPRAGSGLIGAHKSGRGTPVGTPRHAAAAAGDDAEDDDAAALGSSDNIKVIVRVRPRNGREASIGGAACVHPQGARSLTVAGQGQEPHGFAFDHVAGEGSSQESVFRTAGRPIVENCLRGYNGCIFAYGQTGSGKTYTMLGGEGSGGPEDEGRGLVQRVFEHLFARMREQQDAAAQVSGQARPGAAGPPPRLLAAAQGGLHACCWGGLCVQGESTTNY